MERAPSFYAVILAGGSGERFWPLSTPERPKQFLSVFGGKSLIRQAVNRLQGLVPAKRILVITSDALVKATRWELPELPRANVVGEPCRRDTAAAVATACGLVERLGGESAVAAILTADQLMRDERAFRQVLADAVRAAAASEDIVTMGVEPDYPATVFGYIKVGAAAALATKTKFFRAQKFVEKPNLATARRYLAAKRYVWNAGMFVWRVAVMKRALALESSALAGLAAALAEPRARVAAVLARLYPGLPRISIDYAVMEKAKNILVSRGEFGWDDVGTWASVERQLAADSSGNILKGEVRVLDAANSVIIAEKGAPQIAALGIDNLVVVATGKAILVAAKSRVQELKKLLEIKAQHRPGR